MIPSVSGPATRRGSSRLKAWKLALAATLAGFLRLWAAFVTSRPLGGLSGRAGERGRKQWIRCTGEAVETHGRSGGSIPPRPTSFAGSSVVRAPGMRRVRRTRMGRRFESSPASHTRVAQMQEHQAERSGGRWFKPIPSYQFSGVASERMLPPPGPVAQLEEHWTFSPAVACSIHAGSTNGEGV